MRKPFKTIALILALIMIMASLVGCNKAQNDTSDTPKEGSNGSNESNGGSGGGGSSDDGDRRTFVKVGLTNAISSLYPIDNDSPYKGTLRSCVFQHLGQREEYGSDTFVGVMLKSWEQVDEVTYACELYDYIVDSEGNPFTTEDVEFVIETYKEDGSNSAINYLDGIEVIDDYKFNMIMTDASVGSFEFICENLWMFTKEAYEASDDAFSSLAVGTGPYVNTYFMASTTVKFEKNENYWQTDELNPKCCQANVDVIEFNFLGEVTQMGLAIEDKTVQLAYWIDESLVEDAQKVDGYVVETIDCPQFKGIMFNCKDGVFSGKNGKLMRQAVCYAINNQAIIDAALHGVGSVNETWGIPTAIGYNTDWEKEPYYPYDPEKARELVIEAGYEDGVTIVFYNSVNLPNPSVAQVIQANLAAVGITVDYQAFDGTTNASYISNIDAGWNIENGDRSLQGAYLIQTISRWTDNRITSTGRTLGGVDDDYLQKLTEKCWSVNWTQEDLDALHDYVVENAFVYQTHIAGYTSAHTDEITSTYINYRGDLVVGACDFSDSYSVYYQG
ncbi:MAG: ABC transporter substrate-binding protein [Oscillospiraceae bacterium]